MAKKKIYVASLSGGKDSVAMVLKLMQEGRPIHYVVFYDTGMEFSATYFVVETIRRMVEAYGATFVYLRPETDFLTKMLLSPVNEGTEEEHYGYDWCGGVCRWRTTDKITLINKFLNTLDGEVYQYIGIALDEPERLTENDNKIYPLVEYSMTEADALQFCYENGIHWLENGVELYRILKRVSCWCCKNKNLDELRNMYWYLPYYWGLLKGMQSRIDRPFHGDKTIFDLEKRFKAEGQQLSIFDVC